MQKFLLRKFLCMKFKIYGLCICKENALCGISKPGYIHVQLIPALDITLRQQSIYQKEYEPFYQLSLYIYSYV